MSNKYPNNKTLKNGVKLDARDYGKKVFRFRVDTKTQILL
jgi:hypothetical protein